MLKSPSKDFFIRATSNPMGPSANGSDIRHENGGHAGAADRAHLLSQRSDPVRGASGPPADRLFSLQRDDSRCATLGSGRKTGRPSVKGVWSLNPASQFVQRDFNQTSLSGHSRQALFLASSRSAALTMGDFVVVDEDIDPRASSTSSGRWRQGAIPTKPWKSSAAPQAARWTSASRPKQRPQLALPDRRVHALRPAPPVPPIAESSEELKNQVRAKWRETYL